MKKSIQKFGNGKGMKKKPFPQFGNGNHRLLFPKIPGKGNEKKTHDTQYDNKKEYLANMWREKEFWPKPSQPHPPPFLIIPPLLVVVTATINEQKFNQNDLVIVIFW